MTFVDIDGRRVHVMRMGARAGVPVVMAHGLFTGTVASWFFTAAPTLAKDRPVVLYDLRGHGRSDPPLDGDHSSASQAIDLARLVDHLDLPSFHLVGHSFGALVAIRHALRRGARLASLTLVEPPIRADRSGGKLTGETAPAEAATGEAAMGEAWWWRTASEETGRLAPELRRRSARVGPSVDEIRDSLTGEPEVTDDDLRRLPNGTSVVLGDRSAALAMVPRLRRVRPDIGIRVFAGGHSIHVDARDDVVDHLRSVMSADHPAFHDERPENEEVAYG